MEEHVMPLNDLRLSEQERLTRKDYLDFTERDATLLKELNGLIHRHADDIISNFFRHLLRFEKTRVFLADGDTMKKVKRTQKEYLLMLTEGNYGEKYFTHRLKCGKNSRSHRSAPQLVYRRILLISQTDLSSYH